ncbi:Uncharacterised protein [Vibrio cholerae]|nr:Uncharacterised protein [Vibrio cholerae]CSI94329.1 Uncharacterised protein [Vibrio cholerae]
MIPKPSFLKWLSRKLRTDLVSEIASSCISIFRNSVRSMPSASATAS